MKKFFLIAILAVVILSLLGFFPVMPQCFAGQKGGGGGGVKSGGGGGFKAPTASRPAPQIQRPAPQIQRQAPQNVKPQTTPQHINPGANHPAGPGNQVRPGNQAPAHQPNVAKGTGRDRDLTRHGYGVGKRLDKRSVHNYQKPIPKGIKKSGFHGRYENGRYHAKWRERHNGPFGYHHYGTIGFFGGFYYHGGWEYVSATPYANFWDDVPVEDIEPGEPLPYTYDDAYIIPYEDGVYAWSMNPDGPWEIVNTSGSGENVAESRPAGGGRGGGGKK